jgi:hypothetical protein
MKFAIIDLNNIFSRMRFAVQGDASAKAGAAIQTLFHTLASLEREGILDHAVITADTKAKTWRHGKFRQYKASQRLKRASMTQEEMEEENLLQEYLNGLVDYLRQSTNTTVLRREGIEADDFIARWIQLHLNDEHIIVSNDSDLIQLISRNVRIHDPIAERRLCHNGVFDLKGNEMHFTLDTTSAKIKTNLNKQPDFPVEEEWWLRSLFIKCIRGDTSDGIFSSYPGARWKGSKKEPGLSDVWLDRKTQGYCWQTIMLKDITKPDGIDDAGNTILKTTSVGEEYRKNEILINLSMQPQDIVDLMDADIVTEVDKPLKDRLSFSFMQFCGKYDLPRLAEYPNNHLIYLTKGYLG